MAAKMLLAVAAALCAFMAVTGGPARLDFGDKALDQALDQAALQHHLAGDKLGWFNVTKLLERVEQTLSRLEERIEEVNEEVQSAVQAILEQIENAATAAAQKWAEDVSKWVAQANQTNIDVQECLDAEQAPLDQVTADLKKQAHQCIAHRIDKLNEAMSKVRANGDRADRLWEEAKAKIVKCLSLGNWARTSVCLITTTPFVDAEVAAMIAEATASVAFAATEAAAIVPMASLCTSAATAGHAAQVSAIVDTTVTCIKDKLAA